MKTPPTVLLLLFFCMTVGVQARPLFVEMDAGDPFKSPQRYGYFISASVEEGTIDYLVELNEAASEALIKPSLFVHSPLEKKDLATLRAIRLEAGIRDGRKSIRFAIPAALVKSCLLHLDSAPIPRTRTPEFNFSGYRLRLDKVAGMPLPSIAAEVTGDAVRFTVKLADRGNSLIEYGPGMAWFPRQRVSALAIRGPSLDLPLAVPHSPFIEGGMVEFTLPRSLVPTLDLLLEVEEQHSVIEVRKSIPRRVALAPYLKRAR